MVPAIAILLVGILAAGCGSAGPTGSGAPPPTPTAILVSPTATPTPVEPPSFAGLGSLALLSAANAVSHDGSVVVGVTWSSDRFGDVSQAFRWTRGTGMVGITPLPPFEPDPLRFRYGGGDARAVSADGSIVVGTTTRLVGFDLFRFAFRWTEEDGYGVFYDEEAPFPLLRTAVAITPDGEVVVGSAATEDGRFHAYRFGAGTGVELLPSLDGLACGATAISGDGSVVVGCCGESDPFDCKTFPSGQATAVRWDASGGLTVLPAPPGASGCAAAGMSADGSRTVGSCDLESFGRKAVLWRGEEAEVLAELPGELRSRALGISADGSAVVGTASTEDGNVAFVWTEATGKLVLRHALRGAGLATDLSGWFSIESANAVSADGRVVVGWGLRSRSFAREAFRAVLP